MKKDHYQQHKNYKDLDGSMKTFTVIDHDKHTTRTKMGREAKDALVFDKSELEQLCDRIFSSYTNTHPQFIEDFDGRLAKKYQFERYRRGKDITYTQLNTPYRGESWVKDLNQLYNTINNNIAD